MLGKRMFFGRADMYTRDEFHLSGKGALERGVDCDEAVWFNIITGNSTLTIGLAYRNPNINVNVYSFL